MESISTERPLNFWQKLRRLRPLEGQTLVWQMIDLQKGVLVQIAAFVLFILSFHFIFSWTWSMSIAMLISMFLHECGHASVFALARIKFRILFLFPLGAVAAPIDKAEDEKSDRLHWNTISWLLQAGPAVNVILMVLFLVTRPLIANVSGEAGLILYRFSFDMVYVNGLLAIMNLIPVWTLDAGQLFNVLYNSLDEREDRRVTAALLGGMLGLMIFLTGVLDFRGWAFVLVRVIEFFGWVVFLVIFAFGILNKQERDKAINAESKQAMSNAQAYVQIAVYIVLVITTLSIFARSM